MSEAQNKHYWGGFKILGVENEIIFSIQSNMAGGKWRTPIDTKLSEIIKAAFFPSLQDEIQSVEIIDPPKKHGNILEDACVKIELFDQSTPKESTLQFHPISISEKNTYHIQTDYFNIDKHIKFVLGHNTQKGNASYLPPVMGHPNERTLAPGHQLGQALLTISGNSSRHASPFSFVFDVRPVKISWRDSQDIFNLVHKKHYELLFENPHKSSTGLRQSFGRDVPKTKYQQIELLEHLIGTGGHYSFANLIYQIAHNPHKRLITEKRLVPVHESENPDFESFPELFQQPTAWIRNQPSQPIQMYDSIAKVDFNTPPNRFVNYVAFYFSQELLRLKKAFENESLTDNDDLSQVDLNFWVQKTKRLRGKILPIINSPFFQDVDMPYDLKIGNNQVLLKEPRYRKIAENYIRYIRKLEFSKKMDEWFANPLKWMPEIYEYYCLFELDNILLEIDNCDEVDPLQHISAERLIENRISAKYKYKDYNIELLYNFSAWKGEHYTSYSLGLRPDLSIQLSKDGIAISNIIFDAKYRVNLQNLQKPDRVQPANDATEEQKKEYEDWLEKQLEKREQAEKRGKFVTGDIYKMHTYREALLKDGERPAWVIDLYPGTIPTKTWKDGKSGGVGAIPLKPNDPKHLKAFIEEYLSSISG